LSRLLTGECPPGWRTEFLYEHHTQPQAIPPSEGVRTERWAYLRWLKPNPEIEELYDLKTDPLEMHNLAADGKSIVPILRGKTPADWRKSVYYHYYDKEGAHNVANHYGVRSERFTLALFHASNEWELFDNEKDPQQLRNVFDDPNYSGNVTELNCELKRLRTLYGDTDEPQSDPARTQAGAENDGN
jgi:arylsulfatase A-like enzyme